MFRLKFIKASRAQNFHSFVPQNSILPLPQSAGATAHDQRTSGWSSDTGPCFCLALCGALHHCGLCNDYHRPWCRLGSPRWLKKPLQAVAGCRGQMTSKPLVSHAELDYSARLGGPPSLGHTMTYPCTCGAAQVGSINHVHSFPLLFWRMHQRRWAASSAATCRWATCHT